MTTKPQEQLIAERMLEDHGIAVVVRLAQGKHSDELIGQMFRDLMKKSAREIDQEGQSE